jgi:hypothetical protein
MAHIENYYEKNSQVGGGLSSSHDRIIGKQDDSNNNDDNSTSNKNDGPWATAIEDATAYAFVTTVADTDDTKPNGDIDNDDYNKGKKSSSVMMLESVDHSLLYLEVLRELLEKQEKWKGVPYPWYPPTFSDVINDIMMKKAKNMKKKKSKKSRRGRGRGRFTTGRNDNGLTTTTSKPESLSLSHNLNNNLSSSSSDIETTSFKIDTTRHTSNAKSRKNKTSTNNNRFASIADDDDDFDEEEKKKEEEVVVINNASSTIEDHNREIRQMLSAEASPYSPPPPPKQEQQQETMDTLRLLVRLYASQSDLHSKKARILATQSQWLPGAGALQSSIVALARGLELADAEISKTLAVVTADDYHPSASAAVVASASVASSSSVFATYSSQDYKANNDRRIQLERDADVVSVSTKYLVQEKDKYLKTATRQVAKLARILEEMYRKREEARKKLGEQQWTNNKTSKGLFAKTRDKHERELRSLEEALKQLEGTNEDASTLVDEASRLREKLREARYRKHRYNGRQPSSSSSLLSSYPDSSAEEFGWTFTGSMEGRGRRDGDDDFVEFFEKRVSIDTNNNNNNNNDDNFVLIKLDFHFKTGAVKTVVERGSSLFTTVLFDGNDRVDPVLYRRILVDPLKNQKNNNSTNNATSAY